MFLPKYAAVGQSVTRQGGVCCTGSKGKSPVGDYRGITAGKQHKFDKGAAGNVQQR